MSGGAWLFAGCAAALYLGAGWFLGKRKWDRMAADLLRRRANPTREDFITLLAGDVSPETSQWFWEALQVYYQPLLTPHPDDDLTGDLPIDPDEPEDRVRDYCRVHGMQERALGPWPEGQAITPRNLLRWLESERSRMHRA